MMAQKKCHVYCALVVENQNWLAHVGTSAVGLMLLSPDVAAAVQSDKRYEGHQKHQ